MDEWISSTINDTHFENANKAKIWLFWLTALEWCKTNEEFHSYWAFFQRTILRTNLWLISSSGIDNNLKGMMKAYNVSQSAIRHIQRYNIDIIGRNTEGWHPIGPLQPWETTPRWQPTSWILHCNNNISPVMKALAFICSVGNKSQSGWTFGKLWSVVPALQTAAW